MRPEHKRFYQNLDPSGGGVPTEKGIALGEELAATERPPNESLPQPFDTVSQTKAGGLAPVASQVADPVHAAAVAHAAAISPEPAVASKAASRLAAMPEGGIRRLGALYHLIAAVQPAAHDPTEAHLESAHRAINNFLAEHDGEAKEPAKAPAIFPALCNLLGVVAVAIADLNVSTGDMAKIATAAVAVISAIRARKERRAAEAAKHESEEKA